MAGPVGIGAFLEIAAGAASAYPKVQKVLTGLQATSEFLGTVSKNAGAAKKQMMSMLNAIGGKWVEMQDIAFKTGRSMAMSREMAMRYDRMLMQSTKDLARQYGITAKEIAQFQEEYGKATGRNVILTEQQLKSMAALSKITDSATAAQLVDDFDKLGIGIEGSTAKIGLMQERAKALGINATKATQTLRDNIKLAASYSFRNGVADIEKMAIRATSLRMDMGAVMTAADKFSNIEDALQNSAKLQMLGGSFGAQFGNPMGAMYESLADPKAFMDRLEKTIEGKGRYDSKTGQVTFDPVTMMQMKAMADTLGITVDKLTTPAMAKVQNAKVEEEMRRAGKWDNFSEVEQEAIKNLSRTNFNEKTGKHEISYVDVNGETQTKAIEDLTKEELAIAQDRQMSEEGLFKDVQDIKDVLERTLGRARGTTSTKENIQGLGAEWDAFTAQFQNMLMPMVSGWMNGQSFQPWDLFKNLSYYPGRTDFGSHATEGFGFAEGGVVKPIQASVGAIVPGTSYAGDKVPAMVNSGEMILNEREQSGLFSILKSIATTGAMMYGGNKLGKMFGMRGLGLQMGLGNLLSGGRMGIGGMLGQGAGMIAMNKMIGGGMMPMQMNPMMPMGGMNRPFTFMNPTVVMNGETIMNGDIGGGELVEQLTDVADAAVDVTKNTRSFSARLRDLSKKDTFLGKKARGLRKFNVATGRFFNKQKVITRNAFAKGKTKFLDSNFYKKFDSYRDTARYELKYGKTGEKISNFKSSFKDFKTNLRDLFNDGSKAQASKLASRYGKLGTPEIAMTGRHTGVSKVADAASNAVGKNSKLLSGISSKGGKVLGGIGKAGKLLGRAAGPIGTALAIGSVVSDISSASSQYDAQIAEIEKSGLSDREKARAKDKAAKEKNGSIGSSVGGVGGGLAGAAAGAAIGSIIPGVGTLIGGAIGGLIGGFGGEALGKGIGGMFGGGEEEKFLEEQKESAKAIAGNNEEIIKVLKSIEGKIPGTSRIDSNFNAIGKLGKNLIGAAGTAIGSIIPGAKTLIDGVIGKGIDGMFVNGEEEKSLKEQKESARPIVGDNKETVNILKSIEGKMPASKRSIYNYGSVGKNISKFTEPVLGSIVPVFGRLINGIFDEGKNSNILENGISRLFGGSNKEKFFDKQEKPIKQIANDNSISKFIVNEQKETAKPIVGNDKENNKFISGEQKESAKPIINNKPVSEFIAGEQKELAKPIIGDNKEIIKIFDTIEGKVPGSAKIGSNFGLKPLELESSAIQALPIIGTMMTGIKTIGGLIGGNNGKTNNGKTDINLNVSGTIKLEGNGKSVDLDINKLLENPDFVRKLSDVVSKRLNEVGNAGKTRSESAKNNTFNIYNKTNKS